ncbi:MAG: oligopeptide/dipeptide ABC transporter ATP-binding protein [Pseudomonadota bacterium]
MSVLIEARDVSRRFQKTPDFAERLAIRLGAAKPPAVVHALDHVNVSVAKGEVVGLVGESGCGKSTLGRIMAGMLEPSDGQVLWQGTDMAVLSGKARRVMRLAAQIIFQDPMSSLNPRMRVHDIIGEAPRVHGLISRREVAAKVREMLETVGLDPDMAQRFPHQFSGGQRQRIGIARALAVNPDFLVCDESIAALDVSIQAQVINLLMELRHNLGLTLLFISHDVSVIRHISDRTVIMYLGRVVEEAATDAIFARPRHPYSAALLDEVPRIDRRGRRFATIAGEIPSPINPPSGCHFHPRCPYAHDRCRTEVPQLKDVAGGHRAACHLNDRADSPDLTQNDNTKGD